MKSINEKIQDVYNGAQCVSDFIEIKIKPYLNKFILQKRIPNYPYYYYESENGEFDKSIVWNWDTESCRKAFEYSPIPVINNNGTNDAYKIRSVVIGDELNFKHDGFIMGGAIAAIINEYVYGVPAIINDVDYFYYDFTQGLAENEYFENYSDEGFIKQYRYTLQKSRYIKKNNDIKIAFYSGFKWANVLNSFDLNCTMVGYHPISKKLLYNQHFIDFLKTKKIKNVENKWGSYHTLNHKLFALNDLNFNAIIRAKQKQNELKCDYYFDDEIKKILYHGAFFEYFFNGNGNIRLFKKYSNGTFRNEMLCTHISRKNIKKLWTNKKILYPYFEIKRKNAKLYLKWLRPQLKNALLIQEFGKIGTFFIDKNFSISSLYPGNVSHKKFPYEEYSDVEVKIWQNAIELVKNGQLEPTQGFALYCHQMMTGSKMKKQYIELFVEICSNHPVIVRSGICGLNLVRKINIYKKIKNRQELIGIFENLIDENNPICSVVDDNLIIKYIYNTYEKNREKDLIKEPLPLGYLGKYIRELHTFSGLIQEGREMNHCVGGYAERVGNSSRRIFAINAHGDRSTLELNYGEGNRIVIIQHKSKFNKDPSRKCWMLAKLLLNYFYYKNVKF